MIDALRQGVSSVLVFVICGGVILTLPGCSAPSMGEYDLINPVLADNGPHVEQGGIDTSAVNRGPNGSAQPIGFVGVIQNEPTNMTISGDELNRNVSDMRQAGSASGDPNETVSISFDGNELKYIVEQLMGGVLSANYVISDDVRGTVSFKTQTPVPRAAVPTIVRDLLARNGYVMKVINGIYQIGRPETISTLEANAAAGTSGEYTTRVISLKQGNVEDMSVAIAQILPAGATVTPVVATNSLVLRMSPADEKPVLDLVRSLISNSNGNDIVVVLPLRESPPESVAASMNAYFASSGAARSDIPLIIPLEEQQALLIIASSQRVMNNARTLVRGLDKDNRDTPSLRIIALKNLPAKEIADQLNQIFALGGPNTEDPEAAKADPNATGPEPGVPEGGVEGGDSVRAPANIARSSGVRTSDGRGQGSPVAARFEAARQLTSQLNVNTNRQTDQGISIVPDTRNNALLVYATFRQFKRIREVVRALDVPLAQVVIEATIVEVSLNDALKYGVQAFLRGDNFSVRSSRFTDPVDSGGAGGVAIFEIDTGAGTTASFVLEALQTVTDVNIISSPYLTVLDGRAARLSVGDQIPYLVQQTSAQDTGTTTTTNEIEVRDVGIILEVTPSIRADNSVLLNVQQEVSSADSTGTGETLTPVISQRTINSDIVVQSGKTVLLGGLIQDRTEKVTSGVPVISNVPVVGNLFKQTDDVKDRTELLVMITPRVVRRSLQLDNITRLLKSRSLLSGSGASVDRGNMEVYAPLK